MELHNMFRLLQINGHNMNKSNAEINFYLSKRRIKMSL
jgi:hypothetical protein